MSVLECIIFHGQDHLDFMEAQKKYEMAMIAINRACSRRKGKVGTNEAMKGALKMMQEAAGAMYLISHKYEVSHNDDIVRKQDDLLRW